MPAPGAFELPPEEFVLPEEKPAPVSVSRWYWQEDAHNIDKHAQSDVMQPGNYVSYSMGVSIELE